MNTPPVELVLSRIRTHGYAGGKGSMLKPTPRGWESRCPAHDDRMPSLGIAQGDRGDALLKCAAGCQLEHITAALGITVKDLFMPSTSTAPPAKPDRKQRKTHPTIADALSAAQYGQAMRLELQKEQLTPAGKWEYHNADGKVVAVVARFNVPAGGERGEKPTKQFSPIAAVPGGWQVGDPPRWPLYRLADVLRAVKQTGRLWWCEGEKAADAAALALSIPVTTTAHGAKSPQMTDFTPLTGIDEVIITPDNDGAGQKYADDIASRILAVAPLAKVRIVQLPHLPPKGDWVEYLATWGDAPVDAIHAELEELIQKAPLITNPIPPASSSTAEQVPYKNPTMGATPTSPITFPCTDLGNGERFAQQHAGKCVYAAGDWWIWDGRRWKRDDEIHASEHMAKQTVRSIYEEATQAPDRTDREALSKWAVTSESSRSINAMLACARSEPALARSIALFDADNYLLNVQNGTVNLKTGALQPHNPADHITKLCPFDYIPGASGDALFFPFLNRIFSENQALILYVQKLLGMAASGDAGEQLMPIFYGEGKNGKSTLMDVVKCILGDYATPAPDSLLTVQHNGNQHPCELADLQGRRLVIASETEATDKLKLQLVKKLTGEATIKARRMYGEWYEFPRTHHLILQTNHKPRIPEDTEAAWRRLRLVPFTVTIPAPERILNLDRKIIESEAPAVLAWLVAGCQAWLKDGLETPESVSDATRHYREESDPLREFIDECCLLDPHYQVPKGTLRKAYLSFCIDRGIKPIGDRTFTERMKGRGTIQEGRTKTTRLWTGIGLATAPEPNELFHEMEYQGE